MIPPGKDGKGYGNISTSLAAYSTRLMKIGEALEYRSLKERGGKLLIEEGMEAWVIYVRTQRAFLVSWATQEALALCRVLGIQEPELSGEVKRLIEVQPLPP